MAKYVVDGLDDIEPAGAFEDIAPGSYMVRILEHEIADNKKGNPQAITKVEILSGPNYPESGRSTSGVKFVDFNVLSSEFGKMKLKALLVATGIKTKGGMYEASKLFGSKVEMVVTLSKPSVGKDGKQYPSKPQVQTWKDIKSDDDGVPLTPSGKKGKKASSFEDD